MCVCWGEAPKSSVTADGDRSHGIKRHLLLGRDLTLPTKFYLVKALFFPVVMYGCESWTIKKGECQRIVAFEWGVGEDS